MTPTDQVAMVSVELVFTAQVTQDQIDAFEADGGEIDYIFKAISYGWVGRVPLSKVRGLPKRLGATLILEQEVKPMKLHLMKSTQDGRVRPIWATTFNNGTGYDGSTNITIGIVDSGVDETHTDLNGRRVYWKDFTYDAETNPVDYVQHGTHVAGIATGTGAAGGSNTATLYYSQAGDLSSVASNQFVGGLIEMPTSSVTWTSAAKWLGGGSTSFKHYYSGNGTLSFTAFGTNSGPSPLTRADTFTPLATRKYTASLISLGHTNVADYVVTNAVPNYPGVGDGFNKFRGVAPGCNWACAKVADSNENVFSSWTDSAIDDLVANRTTNKIKVMNLSLAVGSTYATQRQKVNTAVNNGIVVVISAGNDGATSGNITDPAPAAKAITVAAANSINQLTEYSSLGLTSLDTTSGQEEDYKPDLIAPGGSDYYQHILAPDSNSGDGTKFPDQRANDYTTMEGTSMSAPFVSGCAALVIDAMESSGYTWNFYTDACPTLVKMLLCATATESNTNRESNTDNPTLQRTASGPNSFPVGKDRYEGYGMINPDAAIEAVVKSISLNVSTNDTFGTNASDRRAWARQLSLKGGQKFTATMTVPATGDFDMYLYSLVPGTYGKPSILASGTSTGLNADESFTYTPATNQTAFIVTKRISGYGTFTVAITNCNDAFSNAFILASTYAGSNLTFSADASQSGSNSGYSTETNEPGEITFGGGRSAWFTWVSPYTGQAALSCNKSVQVYTGSSVIGLTTAGSGINSTYEPFSATAGTTYRIAVFGSAGNYTLSLSTLGITTLALTNNMAIISNSAGFGAPTPYPSQITISGVTQTILKVTATLFDLTHNHLADFDVGLVDPATNYPVYLMSDAGGTDGVTDVTLTFDDSAASLIPTNAPTSGSYQPADYFFVGDRPGSPAPTLTYNTNFIGLIGTSPNGTWSLYAYDDQNFDWVGNIQGGWGLTLTFNQSPQLGYADNSINYIENATPGFLQSAMMVSDPDSTDFKGGSLAAQFIVNGSVDDRLSITNQGTGGGQIGVTGTNLTYGGTAIGTFTGGSGTNPLIVTFTTTNATPAAAQQLFTRLTYANASDAPTTNARTLQFTLTDGDGGGGSASFTETVTVTAVNDVPTLTTVNTITGAVEDAAFTISYAILTNAADEADADGDPISFLVAGVTSGTLKKNGTNVVVGTTLLSSGQTWVWTPATNVNGSSIAAFTVKASDGITNSASAIQVNIGVTNINDAPVVANPISSQAATNGTTFSYTFATNVFTDIDTGQSLTYTATNIPPGVVLTNSTRTFSGTPTQAGSYAVALIVTDNGTPTLSATNSFTLNVAKAPLTITADNLSRNYGSSNPVFTATYTGFVNGNTFGSSGITGAPSLTCNATTNSGPGGYTITNTVGTLSSTNYSFSVSNGTLTVTKAPLLVSVVNPSRAYGSTNPAFTVNYSGFVNGQSFGTSGVTGAPSVTCSATTNSAVGSYVISNTIGTLAATNYSFTLTNGTLMVTNKPLFVTADNFSRTYGVTNPTFTGSLVGVLPGDVITSSYTCAATTTNSPGVYAITPILSDPGSRLGNYTVTSSNGTLTISPVSLLVAAADKSRLYGENNPAFTDGYSGFANGETFGTSDLSGAPSLTTTATSNSPVASYSIVCTSGTLSSTHYTFTFTNGTLTIGKATLVCGAAQMSRSYGATNPVFLYSFYPFANGETLLTSDVTGLPVLSSTATVTSPVGGYAISVAIGTLASSNYSFALGNNWLTISPAVLTVTPDDFSRLVGEPNPIFTGVITGIMNNENITATYDTFATTGSAAGVYTITATLNDPDGKLSNYQATTNQGTLMIITPNAPPSVALTSPTNGTVFHAGETHTISADATDSDGSVSNVEFLLGGLPFAQDTSTPYSVVWTNLFSGTIVLSARATDDKSVITTSAVVTVTSEPYLRSPQWSTSSIPQFQMIFYGDTGLLFDLQYSTNLLSWFHLTTFGITNGGTSISDTSAPSVKTRFYRAVGTN